MSKQTNPTPPALPVDAIETLIAKADAQVAWAGSVFRANEVADAVAQLSVLLAAAEEGRKDTERLAELRHVISAERDVAIDDYLDTCGPQGLAYKYEYCADGRLDRPLSASLQRIVDAARTPDPAREEKVDGRHN